MDAINGIKDSFSSWDKCMSKTYCKWPVIVGIVIGSLILLSVLFCIGRCLCCGAECACCCFRCCAGCCGGRKKGHKHLDSVPNTPYGPQPGLPLYNQAQYQVAPQPVYHNPYSQTATFESAKVHEDSLPAMPSWENASSRKVEVIEEQKAESHELEKLNPAGHVDTSSAVTVPGFVAPQPVRPGGGLPQSPYSENDSFLGAYNGQTTGVVGHADSHSGYRGASPALNPGAIGYGYANHRPGFQSSQNMVASRDFVSQPNFPDHGSSTGAGRGYDDRPNYDRQYSDNSRPGYDRQYSDNHGSAYDHAQSPAGHAPANPVSPLYSGTTAYDHDRGNGYQPYAPYGGGQQGGQGARKPLNGSWRCLICD